MGSETFIRMGIVEVALFAACAAGVARATMMSTSCRT
jgi:hypothetical protein